MDSLRYAARLELIVLVIAMGLVTVVKLFSFGGFTGLLRAEDGSLSPARIQLLVLTVLSAGQYLLATIHDPSQLHPVPVPLVAAVGGSQLLYLASKAWTVLKRNLQEKR